MSAAFTQEAQKKSVTEYLGGLAWDGIPRLDRWLVDCAGAEDSPQVRAASRALLVAAVRRARQPGCRHDQLVILDGPQGSGKSRALQILAVVDAWFTDSLPIADADARQVIEATAGKWIVEASELEQAISATEDDGDADAVTRAGNLKAFLSRCVDEARMPYQREQSRVPRHFVVVGTTAATPLLEGTGNRRFCVVRVVRFDLERLAAIRDLLWAEATVAEASGESIFVAVETPSA